MKKALIVLASLMAAIPLLVVALSLFISILLAPKDSILASLPDYIHREYYSCGGFQDTTDYAKYTYHVSESAFSHSPYFIQVSSVGADTLLSYIENFENWAALCDDFPTDCYDFDHSLISGRDYFYILNRSEKPDRKYDNYSIYFFDLESQILYYFHNNI